MTIADSLEAIDERFDDRDLSRLSLDVEFDSDGEGVTTTSESELTRDDVAEMIDEAVEEHLSEQMDDLADALTVDDMGDDPGHTVEVGSTDLPTPTDGGEAVSVESDDADDSESSDKSGETGPVPRVRDDLFIEVQYPNSDHRSNSASPKRAYPILKMLYEEASPSDPVPVLAFDDSVDYNVSALMPVLFNANMVDRRKEYTAYSNRSNYCYWLSAEGVDWIETVEEQVDELPEPAEISPP